MSFALIWLLCVSTLNRHCIQAVKVLACDVHTDQVCRVVILFLLVYKHLKRVIVFISSCTFSRGRTDNLLAITRFGGLSSEHSKGFLVLTSNKAWCVCLVRAWCPCNDRLSSQYGYWYSLSTSLASSHASSSLVSVLSPLKRSANISQWMRSQVALWTDRV